MSLEDNKLDDLFRERLKAFAPEPPPDMWNRIGMEMERKKKARRMIIYRWVGVAAMLLLALVTGVLINRNDPALPEKEYVRQMPVAPQVSAENPGGSNKIEINRNNIEINRNKVRETGAWKRDHVESNKEGVTVNPVGTEEPERQNYTAVASGLAGSQKSAEMIQSSLNEYSIIIRKETRMPAVTVPTYKEQPLLALESGIKGKKSNKEAPGWKIGVQLAPAYSSHASGYSTNYARAMTTTGNTAQTGMGGGISVQVKTSRRWTVEGGLYYARNGDNSSNSGYLLSANSDYASFASGNSKLYNNTVIFKDGQMVMNSTAGVIRFSQTPGNSKLISGAESAIGMNTVLLMSGDFTQVFDFMEVPLTARYRLIDGKIALELLSGLSANLVVGNQVIMGNASTRQVVGKTEDITGMGFSGIAGFGIIYPLSKRIAITIEPRASYWLTSLNNSNDVDFRPWRIGIYSGLTFGF